MRSTSSASVDWMISWVSCFFWVLWSLNLILMSVWSVRAVFMFAVVVGVTPFFPICMRGLRVWAWCLRRLRVFLSSILVGVFGGVCYMCCCGWWREMGRFFSYAAGLG